MIDVITSKGPASAFTMAVIQGRAQLKSRMISESGRPMSSTKRQTWLLHRCKTPLLCCCGHFVVCCQAQFYGGWKVTASQIRGEKGFSLLPFRPNICTRVKNIARMTLCTPRNNIDSQTSKEVFLESKPGRIKLQASTFAPKYIWRLLLQSSDPFFVRP